jgi:glycerol-3-phosphate O-acyltransferase
MYEPNVTPNKDYKNILMLGYYRNVLVHHFLLDSYTVLSIMSKWNNQPQPKKVVWEDVSFLSHIFQHEFMVRN